MQSWAMQTFYLKYTIYAVLFVSLNDEAVQKWSFLIQKMFAFGCFCKRRTIYIGKAKTISIAKGRKNL